MAGVGEPAEREIYYVIFECVCVCIACMSVCAFGLWISSVSSVDFSFICNRTVFWSLRHSLRVVHSSRFFFSRMIFSTLFWCCFFYINCVYGNSQYLSVYIYEIHITHFCLCGLYVSVQRKGFIKWLLLWAFSFNGSLMHRLSHPVQLLAIKRVHFSTIVIWRAAFFRSPSICLSLCVTLNI